MKKSNKEEMFGKIRLRLVESVVAEMFAIYCKISADPLLQGMMEVGVITEDELCELALDGFMNAADAVTEPDYE